MSPDAAVTIDENRSAVPSGSWPSLRLMAVRAVLVVLGYAAWQGTQALIGGLPTMEGHIGDGLHTLLAPAHHYLTVHPTTADALLIVSSFLIDVLGLYLLIASIVGPTMRPFLGLLIIFGMRQICQALTALPPPEGMIWRNPGFPSLLVTYGVSNDLFFSGHTAIAVFGAAELFRLGRRWLQAIAVIVGVFEIVVVMVLKAHYTMDVYAGAVTALMVALMVGRLARYVDRSLLRLVSVGQVSNLSDSAKERT